MAARDSDVTTFALTIRPINRDDDAAVAAIIRAVMPEFGADGPGFAIHDAEVSAMSSAYARAGAAYFVLTSPPREAGESGDALARRDRSPRVIGGGGIAPLDGGAPAELGPTCELRKMYFLPEARGRGAGERVLRRCLEEARSLGYRTCYLETLASMSAAARLYEKLGFSRLPAPLGNTGHFSCDRFYLRSLT